jgi:hypothetical protein
MVKPENFLEGPIPGQSLTSSPKQYKWERPPQMNDVEEVTKYYINKLADKDVMDDLAVLFDGGMPISPFVETLTTTGVSEGMHTIDVSLIVGPVIHAFIKAAMLEYGVDAKDDTYDPNRDPNEREKRRLQTAIDLAIAEAKREDRTGSNDSGIAILEEVKSNLQEDNTEGMAETGEEPMPEEPVMEDVPAEEPRGLMARGAM